jgi:MinD-like ATPase involved in chromosome partitioning or flagellar assembly
LYIITFYSFKGGVGRTMALVNTGAELARRGRKVLLVDFDLEAPGLSTYDLLRSEKPKPGIVEYVTEFRHTRHSPLVTDFIYEAKPIGKKGGKLWVMPAGRGDPEYRRKLNALNWRTLYQEEDGFLLFEDTRLQWEVELHPDYVLIDARTGHTDIEGICTRQLADAVVVVFYPNEQNLAGLREVCRSIRTEKTSGLKKTIKLHFVASNVPSLDDEHALLRRQLDAFRSKMPIPWPEPVIIIHRHESLRMLDQPVFVLQRPQSRLTREYKRLVNSLIVHNSADRDGALLFLRRCAKQYLPFVARDIDSAVKRRLGAQESPSYESDWQSSQEEADDYRLNEIAGHFLNDAELFVKIAECRTLKGELDRAVALLDRALQLKDPPPHALAQRALCKKQLGDKTGASDDLCILLGFRDLDSQEVLSALRELKAVAPDRLLEEATLSVIKRLSGGDLREACDLLADSTEGLRHAIELMRQFLTECGRGHDPAVLHSYLIRAGQWREVIESLEGKGADRLAPVDLFELAIAHWGETGSLPGDLCRRALERYTGGRLFPFHCGADWLLLWGAGRGSEVLPLLDKANDEVKVGLLRPYSIWRLREVSPDEFEKDCLQFRRMIDGEPVRPAFLGSLR